MPCSCASDIDKRTNFQWKLDKTEHPQSSQCMHDGYDTLGFWVLVESEPDRSWCQCGQYVWEVTETPQRPNNKSPYVAEIRSSLPSLLPFCRKAFYHGHVSDSGSLMAVPHDVFPPFSPPIYRIVIGDGYWLGLGRSASSEPNPKSNLMANLSCILPSYFMVGENGLGRRSVVRNVFVLVSRDSTQ